MKIRQVSVVLIVLSHQKQDKTIKNLLYHLHVAKYTIKMLQTNQVNINENYESFPILINKGAGHIKQPDSPEQHGIGKSPLISSIPTGSKRSGGEKPQSRTNQDQAEKENSSSESSSSNPNLQQQQNSSKENIPSNKSKNPSSSSEINKDEHPSTLTIHSKHEPLSEPNETTSSNTVTSTEPRNEKKSNNPNDDKSDESNASLIQLDLTNHNKVISLMPNVPRCKTKTSSDDDDDYDEVYAIPPNNSPLKQTTSKHNS